MTTTTPNSAAITAPASAAPTAATSAPTRAAARPAGHRLAAFGRPLWQAWQRQPKLGRRLTVLAALALLAAATLAWGLTPAWQQAADRDQRAAQADQRRWRQRPPPAAAPAAAPSWRSGLPAASALDRRFADLLDSALHHGLAVGRSQQQWRDLAPGAPASGQPAVSAVLVSLQVDGSYADLRAWVADALAADPHLALDALRLQRTGPGSATLNAELQWALLQRAALRVDAPAEPQTGVRTDTQAALRTPP
jgi:hypothetical protein